MKPINNNEEGCSPISSNCVIWQGPDIDCINLCKGDTVSDVVHKLATELCAILDGTNVTVYDLSCLDLIQQDPPTFQALIQLLIDKICQLENINPDPDTKAGSVCPDQCIVQLAQCLQYTDNLGNLVTTLPLKDYVILVGNKICDILTSIDTINLELANHETRIATLEDYFPLPPVTLPQVTPQCVTSNPGTAQEIDAVLTDLEAAFCNLREVLGGATPDATILNAINSMCQDLSTQTSLLDPNIPMSNLTTGTNGSIGWTVTPSNLAQSFTNAWITICDLRNAVTYILENCCDTSCAGIELDVSAEMINSTQMRLIFSGNIPSNYADTNTASTIVITDTVTGLSMTLNSVTIISSYYSTNTPYIVTLANGISGTNNMTVATTLQATDPELGNECVIQDQTLALGADACPTLTIQPSFESVQVDFTWTGATPTVMTAKVYDASGTTLQASLQFTVSTSAGTVTINNLVQGTDYKFELVINGNACPQEAFTTLLENCNPPTNVSATSLQESPA